MIAFQRIRQAVGQREWLKGMAKGLLQTVTIKPEA